MTYVEHKAPFHRWFGLSYSSYLVLPRLALEAMPVDWQSKMIALLDEVNERFETPKYHVLRDDPAYTAITREDPEDEYSRPVEFTPLQDDPWANYRRGNADAVNKAETAVLERLRS